jgi:hypothetical protein
LFPQLLLLLLLMLLLFSSRHVTYLLAHKYCAALALEGLALLRSYSLADNSVLIVVSEGW